MAVRVQLPIPTQLAGSTDHAVPHFFVHMDIDLETDGFAELRADFEQLEERGTTDRVYVVGANAEYAVYLEFGTRDMPPYPFFRPALAEFRANPEGFITDNTGFTRLEDIPTADALVDAIATGLLNQITDNADASQGNRSPGTAPDHPKVQTGNLKASIRAERVR